MRQRKHKIPHDDPDAKPGHTAIDILLSTGRAWVKLRFGVQTDRVAPFCVPALQRPNWRFEWHFLLHKHALVSLSLARKIL